MKAKCGTGSPTSLGSNGVVAPFSPCWSRVIRNQLKQRLKYDPDSQNIISTTAMIQLKNTLHVKIWEKLKLNEKRTIKHAKTEMKEMLALSKRHLKVTIMRIPSLSNYEIVLKHRKNRKSQQETEGIKKNKYSGFSADHINLSLFTKEEPNGNFRIH
jgi:hypothetical protein